jgi:uncharacterized protein
METREGVVQLIRQNYPFLTTRYGVKRIGLFGSYAAGRPQAGSDVDLLIEFERTPGLQIVELTDYLETLLGCSVDILTPAGIEAIRSRQVAKNIKESVIYV